MKIFLTGDIHNFLDIKKLNTKNFPIQKELTKNDHLIILGDFGFPWVDGESREDKYWLDWLNNKNFTTLYLDGNHENFNALNKYPEVEYKGAMCHQLRDSVYHIKRGEVITLDNINFLCMGGAVSIDRAYRTENISWWKEEVPSYQEWEKAFSNVSKADVILSHDGPYSLLNRFLGVKKDSVNQMLDRLLESDMGANKWFFGHHHINKGWEYKGIDFYCLYKTIVDFWEC